MHHAGAILDGLDRIFKGKSASGVSDADLLERFTTRSDETAFAALVSRHGPMVLGVCRRALRDEHDVEDAFQATFLIFVRRSNSIRDGERVGPWLHGVAHRVAVRARAGAARRNRREPTGIEVDLARDLAPPLDDVAVILDDELIRLSESLRIPVVLCYLEGLTHDEAATRLGWPVGTVRSRLSRARELLRRRLTRRGVSAPLMALLPSSLSPHLPATLIRTTLRIGLGNATQVTASNLLAQGVLTAMMSSKLKYVGIAIVLGIASWGGVQSFGQQLGAAKPVEASPRNIDDVQAQLTAAISRIQDEEKTLKTSLAKFEDQKRLLQLQLAEALSAKPSAVKSTVPNYTRWGDLVLVSSPEGDKASLYDKISGESKAVRLFESKEPRHEVIPVFSEQAVALSIRGPKVGRLAVFNYSDGTWHIQELREPVETAKVVVNNHQFIVYSFGRFAYAFSTVAKSWDVLELPVGAKANLHLGQTPGYLEPSVEHDGHIYTFSVQKGKWLDLDVRTILETPEVKK
jgi:RNA polymerase sigma factor (sigma-70 family)